MRGDATRPLLPSMSVSLLLLLVGGLAGSAITRASLRTKGNVARVMLAEPVELPPAVRRSRIVRPLRATLEQHITCRPRMRLPNAQDRSPEWWGVKLGVPEWKSVIRRNFLFAMLSKATTDPGRADVQRRTLTSLRKAGLEQVYVVLGVPPAAAECVDDVAGPECAAVRAMIAVAEGLWPGKGKESVVVRADVGNIGERIAAAFAHAVELSGNRVSVVMEDDFLLHSAGLPALALLSSRANAKYGKLGWMLSYFAPYHWCTLRREWPTGIPGAVLPSTFWGGMFVALSPAAGEEVLRVMPGFCGLTDMLVKTVALGCHLPDNQWCAGCNGTCHKDELCPGNTGERAPVLLMPRLSLIQHIGVVSARTGEKYDRTPTAGNYARGVHESEILCMLDGSCGRV